MKSGFLIVVLVVLSLIIGFTIGVNAFLFSHNETDDYVIMSILSLVISGPIFMVLYGLCNWLEPVHVTEHNGVVVDRLIRGESRSESSTYINGVRHDTSITNPAGCILKVRDGLTSQIITIEIDEETFYNKPEIKIGTKVNYSKEEGSLTGDEDFELITF